MSQSSLPQRKATTGGLAVAAATKPESALDARVRTESLWLLTWRRFLRHRAAVISLVGLALIVLVTFGSAIWIPADAARMQVNRAMERLAREMAGA